MATYDGSFQAFRDNSKSSNLGINLCDQEFTCMADLLLLGLDFSSQ